jgi:hypothetical protein
MTTLLEQAFNEARKLPPQQQDILAALIIEAIDEHRNDKTEGLDELARHYDLDYTKAKPNRFAEEPPRSESTTPTPP